MRTIILSIWISCVLMIVTSVHLRAQFPITESFKNSTAPDWVIGGNAQLTSGTIDPTGNGWLRLTNNTTNQTGYTYYSTAFSSTKGVYISFEYVAWGGTGADGISFFLFDGSTPTFNVGAFGGSLGYAQKKSPSINGLSNGYVGIGLDEYGNFSNPTEGRFGGPGSKPHAIVIRGSGHDTTDYRYLIGADTSPYKIDTASATSRPLQVGSWNRKVIMYITPSKKISVLIQYGTFSPFTTIIDNYDLMTAPNQAALPSTFKLGFAASTGASTDYHEIRNLTINVPTDLTVTTSLTPAQFILGSPISYTVTFTNYGPNDAINSILADTISTNISGVTWTCSGTGGATCGSGSGTGNIINQTRTLPIGSSITFTISGTVSSSPNGPIYNTAVITPPSDIGAMHPNSCYVRTASATLVLNTNTGTSTNEGSSVTITNTMLRASETGLPDAQIIFSLEQAPLNGTLKLNGTPLGNTSTFSQDDINTNKLQYTHNGSETTSDGFYFTATDGYGGYIPSTSFPFTINPVNDPPVNTVPSSQVTNKNTSKIFSSGNTNQMSISDPDAGTSSVKVTLTGTNGRITLAIKTGLTFSTGDGTSDITMTFTGTMTNINNAMNGMSFSPTTNFLGTANIQIITDDQGNTGSGGAKSTTNNVSLKVNDPPVIATNNQLNITGQPSGTITTTYLRGTDSDNTDSELIFTINTIPANGILKNNGVALGLNGTFTQTDINNSLITYTRNAGGSSTDNFQFTLRDIHGAGPSPATFNIISSGPLPVELQSFIARVVNNQTNLSWNTATEVNNYGFELFRFDGQLIKFEEGTERQWNKIVFVQGFGTSNTPHSYSYNDVPVANGIISYGLKQIDRDGTVQYEQPIEVCFNCKQTTVHLYQNTPNPFSSQSEITFTIDEESPVQLKVFDASGKEVRSLINNILTAGRYNAQFFGGELPNGMYFYSLKTLHGMQTRRMLLQR